MILFIVGLRRSGTTVFWRVFRQDNRFTCYDEPFNPLHREVPRKHFKQTRTELIDVYNRDPERFRSLFAPIEPRQELSGTFTDDQRRFIQYLTSDNNEHYVIDLTRCHFKLSALRSLYPDSYLIHLHKSPASFASSHLVPSYRRLPVPAQKLWKSLDKLFFFRRRFHFNRWDMEEILGRKENAPFPSRILKDPAYRKKFGQAPAVSKLMAYWDYQYRQVEEVGSAEFGENFFSLRLEDFCNSPEYYTRQMYRWLDIPYQSLDFSHINYPSSPYKPDDPRWLHCAEQVCLDTSRNYLFRE